MDINDIRVAVTVGSLVLFLVLVLRTFSSRRRDEYTEAANLPFVEDLPADVARGEKL